ncbi:MAG: NAD-dependent epimerase/dehydratase family protein [Ardenticatenaceae bacterium]|nr:NAD-dependent epimerase/dehydratase family protein [Ardenticatenaceae bacterium]
MILVTGATGFLGHHLIPQLRAAGQPVRALVRPSSNTQFLQDLGVSLAYTDDISDPAAALAACQGCDRVIHAAGQFRFWGDSPTFWRTNVGGTSALLQAATAVGVQRFIHISTIVVVGTTPERGLLDETTRCYPQEPYQRTKYEAEQLALSYHREKGLPVIVLRPGAFYGPYGRYAFNRLFFEEPLRGWRIKVDGGKRITFPAYVPDVAQGVTLALTNGRPGEVYNICSQSLDHNSVNSVVSDMAGIGRWRINIPKFLVLALAKSWTAVSRYTGREPFYPINMAPYVFQDWHVSTAKAEKELGFRPTPFRKGVQETLQWYRQTGILKG